VTDQPKTKAESHEQTVTETLNAQAKRIRELEVIVHDWHEIMQSTAIALEQIAGERISIMLTEHRLAEIMKQNGQTMAGLAKVLRDELIKD
jgi:hypothetical protein